MTRKPSFNIDFDEVISYRSPMRVSAIRTVKTSSGFTTFPVCPRCRITMEREYQSYCDHCGQALDWKGFYKAVVLTPP